MCLTFSFLLPKKHTAPSLMSFRRLLRLILILFSLLWGLIDVDVCPCADSIRSVAPSAGVMMMG
jgi:hypothetical protein